MKTRLILLRFPLILLPSRMAFHAVFKIENALFLVLAGNFLRIVLVTFIAGVFQQVGRMAYQAIANPAFPMIEGEGVRQLKLCWRPGAGGVAILAGRSK